MKTTSFFRLPIISFIVSFCILLFLLNIKLNEISATLSILDYRYSPDFMRIIGTSLFTMVIMSMILHQIKIYAVNLRNIIFIIITVSLILSVTYWLEMYLTDYNVSVFWYPLLSRLLSMIITYFFIMLMAYFVKYKLVWIDEQCQAELDDHDVIKRIQITSFVILYLSINFVFQRYLYISPYLFLGGGNLPEFHHMSFYVSSMMTILLLVLFLLQTPRRYSVINDKTVIKLTAWIILSQLMISIVISFITIYAVQWYFILTQSNNGISDFSHYVNLLNTMLNSVFIVSVLTCITTYFIGRLWLKRYHYLV